MHKGMAMIRSLKSSGLHKADDDQEFANLAITSLQHHIQEIHKLVNGNTDLHAWVLGKLMRASTDLSDATHAMDADSGGELEKSKWQVPGMVPPKHLEKAYEGFKKLEGELSHEKGVKDPGAVAAAIGRKKYGKEEFQHAAANGHKMEKASPYEKGVHQPGGRMETNSSESGDVVRVANKVGADYKAHKNAKAAQAKHDYMSAAKGQHEQRLNELQSMPKPKLTKDDPTNGTNTATATAASSIRGAFGGGGDSGGSFIDSAKSALSNAFGGGDLGSNITNGINNMKKTAPEGVNKDKYESCVQDVKKQGSATNPWAVCAASLQKMKKCMRG